MGDMNTRYFHQSFLSKRRRNLINALQDTSNSWIYEVDKIQQLVVSYYENLFASEAYFTYMCLTQHSHPSFKVDDLDLDDLKKDFSFQEVKYAFFSMGNYNASGPNGYHLMCFKS